MAEKKRKVLDEMQMRKATGNFFEEHGKKVITASKVKEYFSSIGLRVDGTLADSLAKKFTQMMLDSALRCVGNKRTTVRPVDL
jgi:hypothetical protein